MRYPRFALFGLLMVAVIVAAGVLLTPWPGAGAGEDSDGDGYDDATETYLGTDPQDDCPDNQNDDAWPPDLAGANGKFGKHDGVINVLDMCELLPPHFGHREGEEDFEERRDLNADGINGTLDLAQLLPPMFGSTCPSGYVPPPAARSMREIAIDMDVTGNDARLTQGANTQNCARIDGTGTIDIDVLLSEPGVHADDGIRAWEFLLNYDPNVVSISAEDANFLLNQAAGGEFGAASDPLPDARNGSWRSGGRDEGGGYDPQPEPAGPHEVGPGVLTRITLSGVAQGTTALTLTKVGVMTAANGAIPVVTVSNAWVSVDEECVVPTPTPTPCPDSDGDLWCDEDDNCPAWPNLDQSLPPWVSDPTDDPDCDGFTSADEAEIGTDPWDHCANTPDANDEADDRWPSDFDDNQVVNILDQGEVLPPHLGRSCANYANWEEEGYPRRDLVPDCVINVLDLGKVQAPYFGQNCSE